MILNEARERRLRVMDFNDAEFALALKKDQERVPEEEKLPAPVEENIKTDDDDQDSRNRADAEADAASASPASSNPSENHEEEDIMMEEDDGDSDWVDEEEDGMGDVGEGDEEDDDDDEDEDEDEDEEEEEPAAVETWSDKDAIWGFGSLRVADKAKRAQCTRQSIAFHGSYVADSLVFKDRVETRLPFRWSFRDAEVIKQFDRVMIDDEHIIGQRVSGLSRQ